MHKMQESLRHMLGPIGTMVGVGKIQTGRGFDLCHAAIVAE